MDTFARGLRNAALALQQGLLNKCVKVCLHLAVCSVVYHGVYTI